MVCREWYDKGALARQDRATRKAHTAIPRCKVPHAGRVYLVAAHEEDVRGGAAGHGDVLMHSVEEHIVHLDDVAGKRLDRVLEGQATA